MVDRIRRPLATLVLGALLSACIPHQNKPRAVELNLPQAYSEQAAGADAPPPPTWQEFFDDPVLVGLITEALTHNQELDILLQELTVANAEVIARRGEVLPRLGIGAGVGVEKPSLFTSKGAADELTEVPDPLGDFHVGFNASWEVDIWKKLRNSTKAARNRYLATVEGRNFMITQLVAEIADTYYELLALDNQLTVVQSNITLLEDSLAAVKLQKDAGRVTELGVQRFQAELLKSQSHVFEIQQSIVETENRLNFLCGRYPQRVDRDPTNFRQLAPRPVRLGIPTQLLENRPDVRAAERELEAAKLDVKAARAAFYPSLSIDAEAGLAAFAAHKLILAPESLILGAAAGLMAPLLNRSGIKAEYITANAEQMKAVIDYERTVLSAYIEVANQQALIANTTQSFDLRSQQVDQLERAIETSNNLFRSARADYLEVLTTRREAVESQIELIETKQRQLTAAVDLYQALGGGWTPAGAP